MAQNINDIECKTFGHAWERHRPHDAPKMDTTYTMTLRCERCHTLRIDGLDRDGDLERRRYLYADGYLLDKGEERPPRSTLRLILIRQDRKKAKVS